MKKRWKLFAKIAVGIVLFQLLADGLHAIYVARSAAAWEASVEREPNGALKDCDAYLLPAKKVTKQENEPPSPSTALLMVHGINASPRHYDNLAPALAERGYTCRVMRLPRFVEPLDSYRQTTSVEWVSAVHEELLALRKDFDRVGIVGHSLGGATTIGTLLDHPGSADFAVLLAPAVAVSNSRSPLLSTRSWHEIAQSVLLFSDTVQSPYPLDCRDENKTEHPGRTPFTPAVVVDQLFELMDRNEPRAAEWKVPVTMILSSTDPVVSTPAAKAYFESIGIEDKELLVLDWSGHAIPLDQEWETVVGAIAMRAQKQEEPSQIDTINSDASDLILE